MKIPVVFGIAGLAAAKWSPGTIDGSDKPLVVLYYDEWAKWQQYFSVYQMERMILSRQMAVRNWVINYSFLTWSAETCRLVPTDCEAGWSTPDTQMFPGTSWWESGNQWGTPAGAMPTMIALKQKYPYIKLMFSVGGWSMSHTFSDCIRSNPDNMVESAKDFLYYFDFDGIDLDWEYPECPLDGAGSDKAQGKCGCQGEPTCYKPDRGEYTPNKAQLGDWEVYKGFVQKLRTALDDLEDKMQKKLYVTAAIGMSPKHIDGDGDTWKAGLPVEWICDNDYFDWVNLMTYDFYGPWAPKTGHLSPLYKSTAQDADEVQIAVDESVQKILARCSRPEKLTMGLAAYGKGWSNVPSTGTIPGLWQTAAHQHPEVVQANMTYGPLMTYEQGTITYWDIKYNYLNNPNCQRTFDSEAMAPTIYCSRIPKEQIAGQDDLANNVFISYDDGESWKAKMAYARKNGMAGAIIWAASNSGHEAFTNYVGIGTETHDGAEDLYNGLLEGWYGESKPVGPIGASGKYTFTPVQGTELPQSSTCPYGKGSWRTTKRVANSCYDNGSHPDYQNTRYPKKSGSGSQDMIGKDVILIGKSSNPGPSPTNAPSPSSTKAPIPSSTGKVPPVCTLPPECNGQIDTPAPAPASTAAPAPATSAPPRPATTVTPSGNGGGDELSECESQTYNPIYADYCKTQCSYYNSNKIYCPDSTARLLDCLYALMPYCKV